MSDIELKEVIQYVIDFSLKYDLHGTTPELLLKYYYKDKL